MKLTEDKSLCQRNQKIIVSKDQRSTVQHRATNPQGMFDVRHYKLDGDIIKYQKCCDFLLVNDTRKKAYFIELKGGNIDEAISQLEEGVKIFKDELVNYTVFYRIVCSKAKTHNIKGNIYRKFAEKKGTYLKCKENRLDEVLD